MIRGMDFTILYEFIFGFILGLSIAAPPGPVNAIIANEAIKSPLHGTAVGAGAMSADLLFFLIVYNIKSYVPVYISNYIYILSSIILFYLAYGVLKSKSSSRGIKGNYFVGLTMGITNPYQIIWWFTVGLFMVKSYSIALAYGFFSGIFIWIIIFPFFVKKYLEKYSIYVKYFSFFTLIIFGIIILYSGIRSLI
jgi:threonine/homoserine/homoserine lactone efflux protein